MTAFVDFVPPDQHLISMCWSPLSAHCQAISDVGHATTASTWTLANRAYYQRFIIQTTTTVYKLFTANAAAASGNIDVGVYDNAGTTKLVSSGSTAMTGTTTLQLFDVTDTVLVPGWYWFAMAVDNTTASFYRNQDGGGFANMLFGMRAQDTAFPLPTTADLTNNALTAYVTNAGLVVRTVDP
jgi:hypothetical protein